MQPIENEKVLLKSANEQMTLTNFRVVKSTKSRGLINYSSIFLDKISSVHFRSQEYKWLLYVAAVIAACGVFGLLLSQENRIGVFFSFVFLAAIFAGAYFLTRTQIIEICGSGSERIVTVMNKDFEMAFKFIAAIECVTKTGAVQREQEKAIA